MRDWVSLGDVTSQEAGVEFSISGDPGDQKLFKNYSLVCI